MPQTTFNNMAKLVRQFRLIQHTKRKGGLSQGQLSNLLGYKNGQFISNVERGLCSIPAKVAPKLAEILEITLEDLAAAYTKDAWINYTRYGCFSEVKK